MRLIALFLIGLAIGAFATAALVNALGKRGAHARASMIVLAHHVDALRRLGDDSLCAGARANEHWQQLRFAANEIGYAFAEQIETGPTFRRRNEQFVELVNRSLADIENCDQLSQRVRELEQGCQNCHREFR